MAKHTSGDWEIDDITAGAPRILGSPDERGRCCEIAIIQPEYLDRVNLELMADGEGAANARLIVAAPKLLKALEAILDPLHPQGQAVKLARDAVAETRE